MKKFAPLTCVIAVFLIASIVFAEPKDKSVKAWLDTQERVNAKVETELEKEFKEKFDAIRKVKDETYKIGDTVSISVTAGRVRTIKGTFREFSQTGTGYRAVIGNNQYLLSDIDAISRTRLLYGAKPELFDEYVEAETVKLEAEKARRRNYLRVAGYAAEGYDSVFLETSLMIGDRFYSTNDLGVNKTRMALENTPRDRRPYAKLKLQLNVPVMKGIAVITLGDKAIAATCADFMNPKDGDLNTTIEFFVSKKDLGMDPVGKILQRLNVRLVNISDVKKNWSIRAKGAGQLPGGTKTEVVNGQKSKVNYRRDGFKFFLVASSFTDFDIEGPEMNEIKIGILKAKSYQREALETMAPYITAAASSKLVTAEKAPKKEKAKAKPTTADEK